MTGRDVLAWLRTHVPQDARGRIHSVAPTLATLLVTLGVTTDTIAAAWVAVAVAASDMLLAAIYSTSAARTFLYPLMAGLFGVGVAYGWLDESTATLWCGLAAGVFGSAVAARNTPTW